LCPELLHCLLGVEPLPEVCKNGYIEGCLVELLIIVGRTICLLLVRPWFFHHAREINRLRLEYKFVKILDLCVGLYKEHPLLFAAGGGCSKACIYYLSLVGIRESKKEEIAIIRGFEK